MAQPALLVARAGSGEVGLVVVAVCLALVLAHQLVMRFAAVTGCLRRRRHFTRRQKLIVLPSLPEAMEVAPRALEVAAAIQVAQVEASPMTHREAILAAMVEAVGAFVRMAWRHALLITRRQRLAT